MKSQLQKLDKWELLATEMFPELTLYKGDFWDKQGIDGTLQELTVQLKHDKRIAASGNIYHEIYEKTDLNDKQAWRKSPGIATHYIFLTESDFAYYGFLVSINDLAEVEKGKTLTLIYPNHGAATSMGFLLPLKGIRNIEKVKSKHQI